MIQEQRWYLWVPTTLYEGVYYPPLLHVLLVSEYIYDNNVVFAINNGEFQQPSFICVRGSFIVVLISPRGVFQNGLSISELTNSIGN